VVRNARRFPTTARRKAKTNAALAQHFSRMINARNE